MKVLSSLSPVQIWLFAGTEHNFFLSRINFHCLHTFVSFPSVRKGSFVFLLILLTVFVPLSHCHETLTEKGHNCLHQRSTLERVQIQLQHLENLFYMYQMSVEYFSASSERHLSHPQVNWPRRHVSAGRAASKLHSHCDVLDSLFLWSTTWDVREISLVLSSIVTP